MGTFFTISGVNKFWLKLIWSDGAKHLVLMDSILSVGEKACKSVQTE